MSVAVAVNWNVIKKAWSQDGDLMLQAFEWGKDDAAPPRTDMRGSAYFTIGSPAWESYNEGYRAGLALSEKLAGASDELAFLNDALDSMRANTAQYICSCGWSTNNPVAFERHVRNCRGIIDPLSAGERVGAEFCEAPYRY